MSKIHSNLIPKNEKKKMRSNMSSIIPKKNHFKLNDLKQKNNKKKRRRAEHFTKLINCNQRIWFEYIYIGMNNPGTCNTLTRLALLVLTHVI